MNTDRTKELARILALPEDHPERVAFEQQPDSGAMLKLYQHFLEAPDMVGARTEEAELRLRELIDQQLPHAQPDTPADGPSWLERVSQFLKPSVLAPVAAIVAIAIGINMWQTQETPEPVLRNVNPSDSITLSAPTATDAGGFVLAWEPVLGADTYQVRLLAADLTVLHSLDPVNNPTVTVTNVTLDETGEVRYWQVVALQGGDELMLSPIEVLR
jgi:hypothetical protein